MATAGSLAANIRVVYGDPDADWLTDAVALQFLTKGQKRFCHNVLTLDEIKDYTITAKKIRYDLPTNCIIPNGVMWYQSRTAKLAPLSPDKWRGMEEAFPNATGTPDYYGIERQQLLLGPNVPTTNSATALVSGAMTATATILGFTVASGTFRTKGFLEIASGTSKEIVEFTGVATTTVTGVTRGLHNTTAASFASGASVTQIDLQLHYRKSPTDLTATTQTPDIPEIYHEYLEKYALYLAWISRGETQHATVAYQEFLTYEQAAQKTIGRRMQDGVMRIQDKRNRFYAGW